MGNSIYNCKVTSSPSLSKAEAISKNHQSDEINLNEDELCASPKENAQSYKLCNSPNMNDSKNFSGINKSLNAQTSLILSSSTASLFDSSGVNSEITNKTTDLNSEETYSYVSAVKETSNCLVESTE